MGHADYFKPGDHNAICDGCGFKYKFSALRKDYEGFYMCQKCWEPRHPQERVTARRDKQSVPVSRPPQTEVFATELSWDDDLKQWV